MTQPGSRLSILLLTMAVLLAPDLALAHTGTGDLNGFFSGFEHPILGPDHLVAMLAVGLWGAQLGNPALWVLPITFPLVMAFGGVMGVSGVELPFLETVIAMSGLVLGLAVAFSWPAPLWLAGCIVALFAIFHGNAHGLELPEAASPLAYAVGFVLATGMIHLCGIGIGTLARWPIGERVVRAGGLAVAALGLWYLLPTGA
ncbi:MAG: HupE/UreJ family protein [Geminicoccaceae bacterium]